ncbi:MAG TPA: tetratricopeptide repeat protein, partial [Anaerolinea sp.]|nr:tetratricopeptide repeat protein [Anaerolinea sp.]
TPTPLPSARLDLGEDAIFLGDYEQARSQYQDALAQATDDETRSAASTGIGRSLYLERNYPAAINQLTATVQEYPDSPHLAETWFFLARSYDAQSMYGEAADAYA